MPWPFKSKDESEKEVKHAKEDVKDTKQKRSLFKRKKESSQNEVTTNQHANSSSASSSVSVPPATEKFLGLPTPSGSSTSFSSSMSLTDSNSAQGSESSPPSPALSTLSRSPGSNTSISSMTSGSGSNHPRPSLSGLSSLPRPHSSNGMERKTLSPLSMVTDAHNLPTPPPSPGTVDVDMQSGDHLKRRTSIYNIFRRSQSLLSPNVDSSGQASSRSDSITTLPSTCTAPYMPASDIVPPVNNHRRSSVNFLRRKGGHNQSMEDLCTVDGMLSPNAAAAHRAILMGDPLGGGPYAYPSTLNRKFAPQPLDLVPGMPPNRRRLSRPYDTSRRNSWNGGDRGAVWRAPQFGGRYGGKVTIEEENDMMEYQQSQAPEGRYLPAPYMENSTFQPTDQHHYLRRPTPMNGRAGSPGPHYRRPPHYPPFAPPPNLMPPISQPVTA